MSLWTPRQRNPPPKNEHGCNFHARRAGIESKPNARRAHLAYLQLLIDHRLKCCRSHPCANCKKRGEATSCTYVGRGPRGKAQHGSASPTLVQDRLHHLENLVMSLAQKQKSGPEIDFNAVQSENRDAYATPSPGISDRDDALAPTDTGTLVVKNEGTSYIDSAHWHAILEEVRLDLVIVAF